MVSNKEDKNGGVLVAAIEGGGTTFVISIARLYQNSNSMKNDLFTNESSTTSDIDLRNEQLQIIETKIISSSVPHETLEQCCTWLSSKRPPSSFHENNRNSNDSGNSYRIGFAAVGIACFGPLGVDQNNKNTFGRILKSSPKKEWRNVDIVTPIIKACSSDLEGDDPPPFLLDTDVNAPAMAEFDRIVNHSKQRQISSLAYVTVGTGVGVGLVVNSKPVHGMMHPEGGHICVSPLPDDNFQGYSWGKQRSPYGGLHTVEGQASSVALTERLFSENTSSKSMNRDELAQLSDEDKVWDHAANAIANLCVSLILMLSMEEIVLGGGIMQRKILYDKIRTRTKEILNGYVSIPEGEEGLRFIREPTWGNSAGLVGALVLAKLAYEKKNEIDDGISTNDKRLKQRISHGVMISSLVALTFILGANILFKRK